MFLIIVKTVRLIYHAAGLKYLISFGYNDTGVPCYYNYLMNSKKEQNLGYGLLKNWCWWTCSAVSNNCMKSKIWGLADDLQNIITSLLLKKLSMQF